MPQCQKLDGGVVDSKYFEKTDRHIYVYLISSLQPKGIKETLNLKVHIML